jgi:hypothetical protein
VGGWTRDGPPRPRSRSRGADRADGVLTRGWPRADRRIAGPVAVERRAPGETGPDGRRPPAPPRATAAWRGAELRPGDAFECRAVRSRREVVDAGPRIAGRNVPARPERGTALPAVDAEVDPHPDRSRRDLVGAGRAGAASAGPMAATSRVAA